MDAKKHKAAKVITPGKPNPVKSDPLASRPRWPPSGSPPPACRGKMGCKHTSSVHPGPRETSKPTEGALNGDILKFVRRHGYALGCLLGKGVSANVYSGLRVADNKMFAVKVIPKSYLEASKTSVEVEIELMARVRGHPNVVSLETHFQDRDHVFLVTEECLGGELMHRIQQDNMFSEHRAAQYFIQILKAVQHCHNNSVVHRDIKPENFLFESESVSDCVLKLADFGLAHYLKTPDQVMNKSCGTSYYIAPEVLFRRYTKACDVWSCGIILYLMLSGTVPFGSDAPNLFKLYNEIKEAPLTFYAKSWSAVSASAKSLIRGLLERDVHRRFTLEEALDHPWTQGIAAPAVAIMPQILRSMLTFRARNKFKQDALRVIASKLSAIEMSRISEAFHTIDTDNTGTISINEMSSAMLKAGVSARDLFGGAASDSKRLDGDGDGDDDFDGSVERVYDGGYGEGSSSSPWLLDAPLSTPGLTPATEVTFDEFVAATAENEIERHQSHVWQAFREYDKDGDGYISARELAEALGEPPSQVWSYLEEVDVDRDGHINFKEFMAMLLPPKIELRAKLGSVNSIDSIPEGPPVTTQNVFSIEHPLYCS